MYQYREGKVKSTSSRRVKQTLKPCAYKRSELLFFAVTACLLHNEPTSYRQRLKVKEFSSRAVVKASLKRASCRWG